MTLTERQQSNATELANQLYQAYQAGAPVYAGVGVDIMSAPAGEMASVDRTLTSPLGPHYMTNVDPYAIDRAARLHRNAACK